MGNLLRLVQRRAAGTITLIDPSGSEHEQDTVACAHCGAQWVPAPGSGRQRGWCVRCPGVLCGSASCYAECTSQEQLVERIEAAARMARSLAVLRES